MLNGGTVEDEEGEYTFTGGRGNLVIDYVIGEEGIRKKRKVYIRKCKESIYWRENRLGSSPGGDMDKRGRKKKKGK